MLVELFGGPINPEGVIEIKNSHFASLISENNSIYDNYTFFYKKQVYKKMRLKSSKFPKSNVFIGQNRYFVVIVFKMLKMVFKFKYTISLTTV